MMKNDFTDTLKETLFFTGAGFSKPAGCKLSSEMLEDIEQRSRLDSDSIFTKVERKTIKFILSCLEYHARWRSLDSDGKYIYMPNIEEFALLLRRIKNRENLLPYPVTGNWSDKITLLEQEFNNESESHELDLYSSIENKIKIECYKDWLQIPKLDFIEPLKTFINDNMSQTTEKLDIFTLNNDLVLEEAFKGENAVYTGFVSNKWVGFDNIQKNSDKNSSLSTTPYLIDDIKDNPFTNSRINYYKLHGSLDWARMSDGTIVKIKNDNDSDENIEIKPFLIFGHGVKIYTVEPFFNLLEEFRKSLNKKNYFVIVGYSFFDPHINNLIFNELSLHQEKIMFIINPKITENISVKNKDNDVYFEKRRGIKILKKEKKNEIVNYFENIQKNPFYSENSEFNIKKISPDSFEYIPLKSDEFLSNLKNIINLIGKIKKERADQMKIF